MAQAGLGFSAPIGPVGMIGSDRQGGGISRCPQGFFVQGMRHVDRAFAAPGSADGMTAEVDLRCATISFDGTTVAVTFAGSIFGFAYDQQGTVQSGECPPGQIVASMYGRDRDTAGFPWTSQVGIGCRPVIVASGDWVALDTGTIQRIDIGVVENNAPHVSRGPFCGGLIPNQALLGYARQGGGEGYDGMSAFCANFVQARHSSVLTFTDFAWSQALGGSGWLTSLTLNGTLVSGGGFRRTPYASAAANLTAQFQPGELYVQPNTGYGAVVEQRPSGIAANSFVTSGTCTTGIALLNQQDASCILNVQGLPDIAVGITTPAAYTAYGQQQNITVTATNTGPGATDGNDGFTIVTTLPAGFTAVSAPPNCTLNGTATVVTCALNPTPLAGSASPGGAGASVSFAIPVTVGAPTTAGSYNATATLGRSVPDGDADPSNNDFNTANDTASAALTVQFELPALQLVKRWINAVPNDTAALAAAGGSVNNPALASTANSANESDAGALQRVAVGDVLTLSEVLGAGNVGIYGTSAWSCTGGQLVGNSLTIRPADALATIACTISNTRQATDVGIVKSASPAVVRSGGVVQYTITATNNGPNNGNGSVIRDEPDAGLNCAAPASTAACVASGGAACPSANVPVGTLVGTGITVPVFPAGGQIVLSLQCTVTATGLP